MTKFLLSFFQPAGGTPPPEVLDKVMRDLDAVNCEIKAAGAWVFAGGLHPPSAAKVARLKGADVLITDGPFAETKEILGGISIVTAPDSNAAAKWAGKIARATTLPIEVRPFQDKIGDTAPQKPDDWPRLFTERLNAGDLEGVMELYESDARFVAHSGETLIGIERIREPLAAMIKAKTRLNSHVIKAVTVGDIAQLYTNFEGTALGASGKNGELQYKAIEVLRRQPNGAWKLIIGDPNGRVHE